jgi:hypothetical protein
MLTQTCDTVHPDLLPSAHTAGGSRQEDHLTQSFPTTDPIAASVHAALAAVEPGRRVPERRREKRHPYPYPIHLTPLDVDGNPNVERTLVVIGKNLSAHGVDFYSQNPLPFRRVIASLDCGKHGWVGLALDLAWCRFGRHGWYDNGGRFTAVVESPLLALDGTPRAA